MRKRDAITAFRDMDKQKRRVFVTSDFRKMFPDDSDKMLADSISSMIRDGILERPTRGVYVYADTKHVRTNLLQEVARILRRGHYTYLSLESALSEYGAISQIPLGSTTFMTTGRRGEIKTTYGTIEFSHTSRDVSDFIPDFLEDGRPLPIATLERALTDLRRVGRNTHLLLLDEIEVIRSEGENHAEFC